MRRVELCQTSVWANIREAYLNEADAADACAFIGIDCPDRIDWASAWNGLRAACTVRIAIAKLGSLSIDTYAVRRTPAQKFLRYCEFGPEHFSPEAASQPPAMGMAVQNFALCQ
jgi:hypothetical protein